MQIANGPGLCALVYASIFCIAGASVTQTLITRASSTVPAFLLVGDSLTWRGSDPNGWATRLQEVYGHSVKMINRGHSGYNTREFVEKELPVVLYELETSIAPVLITVWFGANDAAVINGPAVKKHVPLNEYRLNMVKIINEFQQVAPQARILVLSPPVVDDAKRRSRQVAAGGQSNPIDRTNAQAGVYAKACGEVVESVVDDERVFFLDVHSFMMTAYENATARAELLADGVHLSAKGHRVVFELVLGRAQLLLIGTALDAQRPHH